MTIKICIYSMHPCTFIIFSFLLIHLDTTTANHLVGKVVGEGDAKSIINRCFFKEKHALLDFKARLQDRHGLLSTWRAEEDDCCRWIGVTCNNQTHHVSGLNLQVGGLGGKISQALLNLTYLNHLNLSYNHFHGTIPTFIGSMTQLRYLDLSSNSFYGTIPLELGNLTNLHVLFLRSVGRCRVETLDWLSHLSHLQQLVMDGISLSIANHWVNVILSLRELSHLSLMGCDLSQVMYPYSSLTNFSSSLVSLYLANNNLNSSMYHWLLPLTSDKLYVLDLSSNKLDTIPEYVGNLCSLAGLKFDNNSHVVKFPDFLKNLSGCTALTLKVLYAPNSQFIGSVSADIQKFSSLLELILSENQLNGTLSEKLWELPLLQTLDVSSNYLRGAISVNIGRSKSFIINLSKNSLEGVPSPDHMSNLSNVEYIDLSSCKLGPHFPKWVQKLKNLTSLDISNATIKDTIPPKFWDTWLSQLRYLNLSSNNISGEVPDLLSNFDDNSVIDLSSNDFSGPLPNVPSTLASLNLSKNKFSGGISFLCQFRDGFLEFLDLSHNFLTGQLPDCLWHFKKLKVLNLGHNKLSGRLPASVESLIKLEVLYLYKNNFFGELPLSLKNCTSLNSLNLGANHFSGNVPVWIGENLSGLYVLILRSNNFFGAIPLQLCQLPNLHILDLSMNNLHGTIPSCLDNLTSMVHEGFPLSQNVHNYSLGRIATRFLRLPYRLDGTYVDHAMIEWQGSEREFICNLRLLKSIDLSINHLTGQISYELTNLHELIALNLSKNALFGEIPLNIGQMKKLLTLDLSRNNLSGGIPSSMSQMTSLNYLDVSCNKLSGRIPSSTQLQSFEPSRYNGNKGLCGPPITKKCPGDEELEVPFLIGESEGGREGIDELNIWFYIGGGMGFATGFWIACGTVLVNDRRGHVSFLFVHSLKEWVCVKAVVLIANMQSIAHM